MTDKMEKEFEAWVMSQVENGHFYGGYTEGEYDLARSAWQASREALVVDVGLQYFLIPHGARADADAVNSIIDQIKTLVRSSGVKVK